MNSLGEFFQFPRRFTLSLVSIIACVGPAGGSFTLSGKTKADNRAAVSGGVRFYQKEMK